jgi:hypothetical protein
MGTKNTSFSTTIAFSKTPQEVSQAMTVDVPKWWGGMDFSGSSKKPNDEFTIHHPQTHYSKQRVEIISDRKIVWFVEESTLHWLKGNKQEWTGTKMVFELSVVGNDTLLHFTHEGLIPEMECYEQCALGWTLVLKDWLFNFIEENKPHFLNLE